MQYPPHSSSRARNLFILVLLLAVALFAGCGEDDANDTDTGPSSSGDTNMADTNTADTNTDEDVPGDTNTGMDTNPGDTNTGMDTNPGDTNTGMDTNPGDTNMADTNPGDTNMGDTNMGMDTNMGSACDHEDFIAAADGEDAAFFLGAFTYIAQTTTTGAPVDTLNFELLAPDGASTEGTYALTDDAYQDCDNCVLIYLQCDENLANCEKTFLAQEGTLTITSPTSPTTLDDASGEQFTGTLTDVVLYEVTIDDQNNSTLVTDGETWCLDSYSFDATIQ